MEISGPQDKVWIKVEEWKDEKGGDTMNNNKNNYSLSEKWPSSCTCAGTCCLCGDGKSSLAHII